MAHKQDSNGTMKIILGRDIKPLDIVIIRGQQQIVESAISGSLGNTNRLRLVSGITWPVFNSEQLVYLGQAELADVLGIPESELCTH